MNTIPTPSLSVPQIWARLRKCETYNFTPTGEDIRDLPDDLYAAILAQHKCPNCARFPELHHLVPLTRVEESAHCNAGWECGNCDEFYPSGNLYEYGPDPDEWRGDADPGL